MLHPALTRAIATAHIEDLHRASARWRLARRVVHEPRVAATPTAVQRSALDSTTWTPRAQADGMTRTEIPQAALSPCQSVLDVRSGPPAGIDRASSNERPASSLTRTSRVLHRDRRRSRG
jgi:hypothetical protein